MSSNATDRETLLAAMRAAPEDAAPRLRYAKWLTAQGDPRGEILLLQERDRGGAEPLGLAELERLLLLTALHGFVRVPDDPCEGILPFTGGGSHPTQYEVDHEGVHYYLRWRRGFSISVDSRDVLECQLDTLSSNAWTYRETTVILSIVSAAIREGRDLSTLTFPDGPGIRAHPLHIPGRSPLGSYPGDFLQAHGLTDDEAVLEPRNFTPWYGLWRRRNQLLGIETPPFKGYCGCQIEGLSCDVLGCFSWRAERGR